MCNIDLGKIFAKILEVKERARAIKPKKPEILMRSSISAVELTKEFESMELKSSGRRLDSRYYFPTLASWGEMFGWIYLTQELPKYSVDEEGQWNLDCEDFALWLKVMCSLHFGINTNFYVTGTIPRGAHGFNLLKAAEGYYLWEPNPGFNIEEPFTIMDEREYNPIEVFG